MIPSHFTIAHKNRAPSRGDPSTIVSRLKSNSRQCSLVVVDIPMCCCMSLVAASADTRNVVKLIFDGQWRWWASSTTAAIHNSSRLLGRSRSSPSSWMRTFLAETTTTRKRSPNGNKKERNYVGKHDRDEKESFFFSGESIPRQWVSITRHAARQNIKTVRQGGGIEERLWCFPRIVPRRWARINRRTKELDGWTTADIMKSQSRSGVDNEASGSILRYGSWVADGKTKAGQKATRFCSVFVQQNER